MNFIVKNGKLSLGAKVTYSMFLHYAWNNESCFPGQDRVCWSITRRPLFALRSPAVTTASAGHLGNPLGSRAGRRRGRPLLTGEPRARADTSLPTRAV